MSRLIIIAGAIAASGLAACAPGYDTAVSSRAAMRFDAELAGLVAGRPQNCLPSVNSAHVVAARGTTLAFRDGDKVYTTETSGGCSELADSHYTMVTESFGGTALCSGSLVKVVDLTAGGQVHGTCVLSDFTPYRRP